MIHFWIFCAGLFPRAENRLTESPACPKPSPPSREHLECLIRKQYLYGYMVFFNLNICRNNTQDVRQITD